MKDRFYRLVAAIDASRFMNSLWMERFAQRLPRRVSSAFGFRFDDWEEE